VRKGTDLKFKICWQTSLHTSWKMPEIFEHHIAVKLIKELQTVVAH